MHQPMVEAEEVHSLATVAQLHDPGLGLFRLQPEIGQQGGHPRERSDRLPLGPAEHHKIIGLCRVPGYAAYGSGGLVMQGCSRLMVGIIRVAIG